MGTFDGRDPGRLPEFYRRIQPNPELAQGEAQLLKRGSLNFRRGMKSTYRDGSQISESCRSSTATAAKTCSGNSITRHRKNAFSPLTPATPSSLSRSFTNRFAGLSYYVPQGTWLKEDPEDGEWKDPQIEEAVTETIELPVAEDMYGSRKKSQASDLRKPYFLAPGRYLPGGPTPLPPPYSSRPKFDLVKTHFECDKYAWKFLHPEFARNLVRLDSSRG
ncbi:hypothetical protein B0H10DRAFT_1941441 [Mycena sp. CBHHK59/15]|nr:hypothetical protein B0H10DRAFT_2194470 [Mycena sp. CBHHK59/15]KAJ6626797.1 hypothetical protein B0H10DRAFT_1941441 [Mycena sp. CBHHK59/15]